MVKSKQTPSGTYHLEPHETGDYWYFIPNQLPPKLTYDDELMNLAMEAQRYLSELGTRSNQVPNVSMFLNAFMQKEAEFSCQIEGTQATIRDAIEQDAGIESSKRPPDSNDILNYLHSLQKGG